jgi:hypothetical protein
MGLYLRVLVWHAIKDGANLFRLTLWGVTMGPHPFRPHAPFQQLGHGYRVWLPLEFFLLGFPSP